MLGKFDAIWMIPSPLNPHKSEETLVPADLRLSWVQKAIEGEKGLECSDVEFHLGTPSYTHRTVTHLYQEFRQHQFSLIMGADNLQSFHSWNHAEELAKICPLHVYARPGYPKPQEPIPFGATWYDAPLLHISATEIRDLLANQKPIDHLVPQSVIGEVEAFFQHFLSNQNE
jgi:nicotinate-nucleotide adenylyltransferase